MGWAAIAWLLVLATVGLWAYGGVNAHPSLYERTQGVAAQLRCPVCQGESVADSQSDIARSIRQYIQRELARGESSSTIIAFLLSRYPTISLAPSNSGVGRFAWLAPPFLVLGGIALLLTLVVDWRRKAREDPVARLDYLQRIRAEVAASETQAVE